MSAATILQCSKNRLDLLSLKKNRKKKSLDPKLEEQIPTIVLDESVHNVESFITRRRGNWKKFSSSPIVIDDSFEGDNGTECVNRSPPLRATSDTNVKMNDSFDLRITPDMRKLTIDTVSKDRPSNNGWSPSQDIICISPKFITTPSRSKDVANESIEECSMERIQQSHQDILDELYGDMWKSIPGLFKKKHKSIDNIEHVTKKLDFANDSDKENDLFTEVRKFYAEENVSTPIPRVNVKLKKKLYTETVKDTPEIRKVKEDLLIFTEPKPKVNKERVKEKVVPQTEKKDVERRKKRDEESNEFRKVKRILEPEYGANVEKLSFMASLADDIPSWRCEPTALEFKRSFKTKRDQLTRRLFQDFNRIVFDDALEADMPILWDSKLRTAAGTTTNRLMKSADLVKRRTSSIKLSTKVIDGTQRLRDTLIHEMCHAATWIIDQELRAGHGPLWRKWTRKALKMIPELEEISRCHELEIHCKYSYKCIQCGYTINRHSKSIDITKKCCGYCRGKFELILNKKKKDGVVVSTPAKKTVNDFALYVKENYASVKSGRKHAEVMKILSEQYAEKKNKA